MTYRPPTTPDDVDERGMPWAEWVTDYGGAESKEGPCWFCPQCSSQTRLGMSRFSKHRRMCCRCGKVVDHAGASWLIHNNAVALMEGARLRPDHVSTHESMGNYAIRNPEFEAVQRLKKLLDLD